jgi:hypothetical protein
MLHADVLELSAEGKQEPGQQSQSVGGNADF